MTKVSIWKKVIYGNLQNTARSQDLHSIYAPWVLWVTWRSPRKPFLDSILTMDLAPLLVGRTAKTGSVAAIPVVGPILGPSGFYLPVVHLTQQFQAQNVPRQQSCSSLFLRFLLSPYISSLSVLHLSRNADEEGQLMLVEDNLGGKF